MVAFDSAHRAEFADLVGYELWLLDDYRSRLFRQSEGPGHVMAFNVSRDAAGAVVLSHGELTMQFVASLSGPDVASALSRFRVAAFGTAFKIHDLLVEWLLEASTSRPPPWQFTQKLHALRGLGTSLHLPPELNRIPDMRGFLIDLYAQMSAIRNPAIHQGGVRTHPDSSFEVTDKSGDVRRVGDATQAAYARFACVIARQISDATLSEPLFERVVLGDVAALLPSRQVIVPQRRVGALELTIDPALCSRASPCRVDVPLAEAVREAATATPTFGGTLFLDLSVTVDLPDRSITWTLPTRDWDGIASITLDETDPNLHAVVDLRSRT